MISIQNKGNEAEHKPHKHLSSFRTIILGFLAIILLGSFLLMLPIASQSGQWTPFANALFTAVSSACVTGLIVYDTATTWTMFGQLVIIILIQIGGLGVVTTAVAAAIISGRKIGIMQRSTMQDSISAPQIGGIVRLTWFIVRFSLAIELVGALLLSFSFVREFGILKGLWYSVFHSVSAFCNAGFDLMGIKAPFSSLVSYNSNYGINIIIMALIIIGGLGFLTWNDIITHKINFKKYRLQSKVILTTSLLLIAIPATYFFFGEFNDDGLSTGNRVLVSLFQAISPRTAGFNTVNLSDMTETGRAATIILMLIGGSPGSTAGGMKTTTFAVLIFSAIAVFRHREDATCFGRRIPSEAVRNASTLLIMYIVLFAISGLAISRIENLPLLSCLFETASAIGTVGLSLGITPSLGILSRLILIVLMFVGRVGGLTVIFAAISMSGKYSSKLPQEKITVG